jgi:hypothetical protein
MDNRTEAKSYNLARMTGCISGRVPDISPVEALSSGLAIKAVNIHNAFPVYADLIAIDYGTNEFTLEASHNSLIILPLSEHKFFYASKLAPDVTKKLNSSIVIDGELFTVIHDDPIPIWMGNDSLIYYADDIQNLINKYKNYNILW